MRGNVFNQHRFAEGLCWFLHRRFLHDDAHSRGKKKHCSFSRFWREKPPFECPVINTQLLSVMFILEAAKRLIGLPPFIHGSVSIDGSMTANSKC